MELAAELLVFAGLLYIVGNRVGLTHGFLGEGTIAENLDGLLVQTLCQRSVVLGQRLDSAWILLGLSKWIGCCIGP